MIFVLLLIGFIRFTTVFGAEDEDPFSPSNPNILIFYELYNGNRTQEIVTDKDLTNQEKLQKLVETTQNTQPEEVYSMFNRTIYIKNIADKALVDKPLRKNIYKCYFANLNVHDSYPVSKQVEIARKCFDGVTKDQEHYMCSYLTELVEWSNDYGDEYNPISDMFFNYYRRVDCLAIAFEDNKTTAQKRAKIWEVLFEDKSMELNEQMFLNTHYGLRVEPMYNASKFRMMNLRSLNSTIGLSESFLNATETKTDSSPSDPNVSTFYELYNRNQTQEIVKNNNLTNQEKLEKFVGILSTQNNQTDEIYSMFNRTIYIKNIADKVLVDENLRKIIFKCFFANIDVIRSVTATEKLEIARKCFTDVTEDQEKYISDYLNECLKWTNDYSPMFNPLSDMLYNYYRRVDILAIIYRDDLTFAEKKAQISDLLENDRNMDSDEKLYFDTYYDLMVEPIYNSRKLKDEAAENSKNLAGLLKSFSNGTRLKDE